jgi:uncharacterized protein YkwD
MQLLSLLVVDSSAGSICIDMLGLVNQARARQGLRPVSCANELHPSAQRHSNDMARNRFLAHKGGSLTDQNSYYW